MNKNLIVKETQMVNKDMKRSFTLLLFRKIENQNHEIAFHDHYFGKN